MAHFYLSDEIHSATAGDTVAIVGGEARHAVSVSRVRIGERLSIGNGAGLVVGGVVASADPDRLELVVDDVQLVDAPSPALWLVQALAKGGRDESAVQAACELGVDGVIPWSAARSIVRWEGEKIRKGRERWAAIVREATKQSMRARIPDVSPPMTTAQLEQLALSTQMLVLVPGADAAASAVRSDGRDLVLVVGPEGGTTPQEIDRLVDSGASAVRLGSGVLRTSTAGPAAIALLNVTLGRW